MKNIYKYLAMGSIMIITGCNESPTITPNKPQYKRATNPTLDLECSVISSQKMYIDSEGKWIEMLYTGYYNLCVSDGLEGLPLQYFMLANSYQTNATNAMRHRSSYQDFCRNSYLWMRRAANAGNVLALEDLYRAYTSDEPIYCYDVIPNDLNKARGIKVKIKEYWANKKNKN